MFEKGTNQTDSLQVSRATITIGNGSSIAKKAIAFALEVEKREPQEILSLGCEAVTLGKTALLRIV